MNTSGIAKPNKPGYVRNKKPPVDGSGISSNEECLLLSFPVWLKKTFRLKMTAADHPAIGKDGRQ